MELKWQWRAKVVAYVDLVLSVFSLLLLAVSMVAFMTGAFPQYGWTTWIGFGILIPQEGVELWAANLLLRATEMIHDPKQSLNRAITWRIVAAVCIGTGLLSLLGGYIIAVVTILLPRGIMIYIVSMFITELTPLVSAAGGVATFSPNPDTVVVRK